MSPILLLTGNIRNANEKMIIIELDERSKTMLQGALDKLPETTNVRTINYSGSFYLKLNGKTRIRYIVRDVESISDARGYRARVTTTYRYYKFTQDGVIVDGYTFTAIDIDIL